MGQTDTLLDFGQEECIDFGQEECIDFGQEECIDFGQENNIPENNSSELKMAASMIALENYQPAGYFIPMFKDTNLSAYSIYERFHRARIKHRIKYIRLNRSLYLYNVQDVFGLFIKDIDLTKLPATRKRGQRISPQTRKMAAKFYTDGYGVSTTAKALNMSARVVQQSRHMFSDADVGIKKRYAAKRKQAEQLYLEGYPLKDIAAKVGLSVGTINRHIKNQNIPRRKDRAADFEEQLIKCYNAGTVIDDLRKKFHVDYSTIKKCLLKHDPNAYKSRNTLSEECKQQIVTMRTQGASYKCIRDTLHVSRSTIRKYLTKAGLITNDTTHT
jgi:transposase-like protein